MNINFSFDPECNKERGFENQLYIELGDTHKQALKLICQRFFKF